MQPNTLICSIKEADALDTPEFKSWTRGLSPELREGATLMLSYGVHMEGTIDCIEIDFRSWIGRCGSVESHLIELNNPTERVRGFVKTMRDFFGGIDFDLVSARLFEINPRAEGEVYHVCLSAHGLIMAAARPHAVVQKYGPSTAFGGFVPAGLSSHARLAALAGLQLCANALLAQHSGTFPDNPYEVHAAFA